MYNFLSSYDLNWWLVGSIWGYGARSNATIVFSFRVIATGPAAKTALVLGRFIANTSGKVKSLYGVLEQGKPYAFDLDCKSDWGVLGKGVTHFSILLGVACY